VLNIDSKGFGGGKNLSGEKGVTVLLSAGGLGQNERERQKGGEKFKIGEGKRREVVLDFTPGLDGAGRSTKEK